MARAIELAAGGPPPVRVEAPMCVQATFFEQQDAQGKRLVVHLFNGLDTAANHGLPKSAVPLREETVPVHGIRVRFPSDAFKRFHVEPGAIAPEVVRERDEVEVRVPPLEVHVVVVGER
jgi:hypothetical protein